MDRDHPHAYPLDPVEVGEASGTTRPEATTRRTDKGLSFVKTMALYYPAAMRKRKRVNIEGNVIDNFVSERKFAKYWVMCKVEGDFKNESPIKLCRIITTQLGKVVNVTKNRSWHSTN